MPARLTRSYFRALCVVLVLFPFLLLSLCGCVGAERAAGDGWVRQENPLGFTVVYPQGARVEAADDGRVTVRLPGDSGFALIQPFLLTTPETPDYWLKSVPIRLASVFPQAKVARVIADGTGQAEADLTFAAGGKDARARLVCVIDGMAGNLYAVAAPVASFAARQETLARIVASFRYTDSRLASSPTPDASFTWTEPNEGMFAAELPSGWTVKGGFVRRSAVDNRMEVKASSPDGKIRLVAGDADISPFALPTGTGAQLGVKEGDTFAPGDGTVFTVRRYLSGLDFAREYVQTRLAKGLPNATFTTLKDRPDLAAILTNTDGARQPLERDMSVGSVEFAATMDGRPWRGYCLAGTIRLGISGVPGGAWEVTRLYGYVCDAEREAEAQAALYRLVRSLRLTPDWLARQPGPSDTLARTFRAGHLAVADDLRASLRTLSGTPSVSNMTLGMTEYADLERGQHYRHVVGSNVYWQREGDSPGKPATPPNLAPLARP